MQQQHQTTHKAEDDITLFEIFSLIQDNWKTILCIGFAGAVVSGGYLAVVPPKYEANALIEMAQLPNISSGNNTPLSISIEAPVMLVERLKSPSTYTRETIEACRVDGQPGSAEGMAAMVEMTLMKNLMSVVRINVRRDTPELAKQCVGAIFEMISSQQAGLAKPYRDELNITLTGLRTRLRENRAFVAKAEKAGLYQTAYLAKRDESIYLTQQIDELERNLSRSAPTRLVTPIYVSSNPVFPKRRLTLTFGTMAGLMLGLLVAFCRTVRINRRAKAKA